MTNHSTCLVVEWYVHVCIEIFFCFQTQSEDSLRLELTALQEDKYNYENTAKVVLLCRDFKLAPHILATVTYPHRKYSKINCTIWLLPGIVEKSSRREIGGRQETIRIRGVQYDFPQYLHDVYSKKCTSRDVHYCDRKVLSSCHVHCIDRCVAMLASGRLATRRTSVSTCSRCVSHRRRI